MLSIVIVIMGKCVYLHMQPIHGTTISKEQWWSHKNTVFSTECQLNGFCTYQLVYQPIKTTGHGLCLQQQLKRGYDWEIQSYTLLSWTACS